MKISLEFESVREMREFYEGVQFVPYGEIRNKKPKEPPEKTSATEPKKTEESTEKALKEEIKIEDIRKLLSVVNKKTGTNTAKEWVKEAGFKSLADITDQKILVDLKAKAEEVLNAE